VSWCSSISVQTGSEASSESQTELEQKLAMERLKAKQLEEQLAALQAQQKSAQEVSPSALHTVAFRPLASLSHRGGPGHLCHRAVTTELCCS